MNVRSAVTLGRKALRKPPRAVARRAWTEARTELERFAGPLRGRRFSERALLAENEAATIDGLWEAVLARPYPFVRSGAELAALEQRRPEERVRVLAAAERALKREVDVLGTGPVLLGIPADWHCDWKTGRRWRLRYGRRIEYAELHLPSDVKVPWEISRLQWLLPAGQAYLLTGDDRFAVAARDVIDDWLDGNPYALGVNWAIAMEPAIRTFSLSWLLYACGRSESWSDTAFRSRFLRGLYLHVDFVDRHIERSDVNGNHYTADAAALAMGGLVLGVERWGEAGWRMLVDELPRQVLADGVDFEAATAYHRLVGELFALPALLRRAYGLDVPAEYVDRVEAMGRFTVAYTGPDGRTPIWGDNDDGRALPLGGANVDDHRSLPALAAVLADRPAQGNAEADWLVAAADAEAQQPTSAAFGEGGFYVLASGADHVFIDCGPVGLAGRGGHGHNDCLSFAAVLAGTRVIIDSGSYAYTGDPEARNRFRATDAHNTPRVDGAEQNRITESLWMLRDDAKPEPLIVESLRFRGSHTGYLRLTAPVRPIRTIALDPDSHALAVSDRFEGRGDHLVEIPYHFAPELRVTERTSGVVGVGDFVVRWRGAWECAIEEAWVSSSYGVRTRTRRLVFRRSGPLMPLLVLVAPADEDAAVLWSWAQAAAA
jgi:hypothetical protein